MTVYHSDDLVTLHHGDALDVLRTLPDASVDAVVTDPPYGLEFMGKDWDRPWAVTPKAGVGFEGREDNLTLPSHRDSRNANCRGCGGRARGARRCTCATPQWDRSPAADMQAFQDWCTVWTAECLRVLKPGGHLLAFGGTRTWHRLACAVEDAGFEVRDSIAWLYGSGFPKSLDVSKAIDRRRTEDLEPVRVICRAIRAAMDVRGLKSRHLVEHFDGCHPRLIDHWAARDTDSQPSLPTWEQWETLTALFSDLAEHDAEVWRLNGRKGKPGENWDRREVTGHHEQASPIGVYASKHGAGKGHTAKERRDVPATPDAEKWQGWGTALKPGFEPIVVARKPLAGTVAANVLEHGTGALNIDACRVGDGADKGRWPTNVVLDDTQAEVLDEQAAGASRFFPTFRYQAKAPASERPKVDGTAHPTVKPVALMSWLVRLVTPPAGVVLEPFAGSGTTVEACIIEGVRCIAIEREAEYLPLITERISRSSPG